LLDAILIRSSLFMFQKLWESQNIFVGVISQDGQTKEIVVLLLAR
jgi:hypothetical protein